MTSPDPGIPGTAATATSRVSRASMNSALGVSLIAIILTAALVVTGVASMLTSALAPGTGKANPSQEVAKLTAQHQEQMKTWQDRFNGRSAFYKPPAPAPPPRDPPKHEVVKPVDPGPPPIPDKYQGPSVLFATTDFVRFKAPSSNEKQLDINVGEEKSGVKVLSTEGLPWMVKLAYKGGEYEVPIFQRPSDDKHLLAQAPPMKIIPSLLEVPAAKLEIQTPKSSGDAEPPATMAKPGAAAAAQNRNRAATAKPETPTQAPPKQADREQSRKGAAKEADAGEANADGQAQDGQAEQQHPEHATTQPQKDDGNDASRESRMRRGREQRSSPRRPGTQ